MSEIEDKINSLSPEELDLLNSDPQMLADFKAKYSGPSRLGSFTRGVMSGVPGAETAISGIESALTPKTYKESHQELEDLKNKDWETNPKSYGAGKVTGIVGTSILAPEVEGLSGAVGLGAGIGALSGADTAATPSDIPLAAAKSAPVGAVLGGAGHAIGKILPTAAKSVVASLGSETTVPGVESYLDNPEAINNALSKTQLGEKLANITSDIGTTSGHLSENARGLLNPENNPLNLTTLKEAFKDAASKYAPLGREATSSDQTAIGAIADQLQKLSAIAQDNGGNISEDMLRTMIDRMQAATKANTWGNPEASAAQTAIKELSGKLNEVLRSANTPYAEGMAPAADMAKLASKAKEQFKLEPNTEGELAPTDATFGKIGNVIKEGKTEGANTLDEIQNATGQDLKDMIEKSQIKSSFQAPGAGSATKTLLSTLGYGVGRMTGVPFGGIGGAAVGRYASEGVNGGNLAKGILDMYLKGSNSSMGKIAAKFGPVLVNAAKTGGNELAATHFVLATSNPEYQALTEHIQNNLNGGE